MSAMQETISRIAGLARSGRLDEAAIQVASAAAGQASLDPVLAALGGAVEFHRGQFARAADYLQIALRAHPNDMTVRANLVEALYRTERGTEALALCDEASARADRTLRIARLGAHLAQEAGNHNQAIALYRLLVAHDPADWAAWNNLGNTLDAKGEFSEAATALEKAAALAPDSQPIRLNLGNALIAAERYEEAEKVLSELAAEFADDPKPLLALFAFYRRAGLDDKSYDALIEAVRRDPGDAVNQASFGQEAAQRNHHDAAEAAFEAALALDPAIALAWIGLASTYERTNREDRLDPLYERACQAQIAEEPIAFIEALRFKRAGQFEQALEAVERTGEVVGESRRMNLRGTVLDRLGRHDEAFAAFARMNELTLEEPSRPAERAKVYRDVVEHGRALATPLWHSTWEPAEISDGWQDPVVLLGFPRSGTTLLDTMLMSDPTTRVLEEEKFIADLEREVGGIEALPGMTAAQIAAARASYFERVGKIVDLSPGSTIVDKHPLHLNKVPIITRLFPKARYILALRHPCDVLLSCFITNFRTNHAMSNFLELETAAELYDMTFSYWLEARETFGLDVRTVVYERLVEDTARELVPLFDWLGLTYPETGLDHRDAARARGLVRTASYAQVTEPVYTRSAGRWKRYEQHLAPILPRLAPWVEQFGYSLEDGRIPGWPETSAA
jgi:tetratricopeptide (TPR) repeat protein